MNVNVYMCVCVCIYERAGGEEVRAAAAAGASLLWVAGLQRLRQLQVSAGGGEAARERSWHSMLPHLLIAEITLSAASASKSGLAA